MSEGKKTKDTKPYSMHVYINRGNSGGGGGGGAGDDGGAAGASSLLTTSWKSLVLQEGGRPLYNAITPPA